MILGQANIKKRILSQVFLPADTSLSASASDVVSSLPAPCHNIVIDTRGKTVLEIYCRSKIRHAFDH